MTKQQIAKETLDILKKNYPIPKVELIYKTEMQLAFAVALSAQTTDKKVNEVTATLFKKYKTWEDFANADLTEMTAAVRGVNFHKGKADRLIKAAQLVLSEFGGKLPKTMAELTKIPGIARKSANVIMQELWDIADGFIVDTHVTRVSNLLTLTTEKNAVKIEKELMKLFPQDSWRHVANAMVLHGRYICIARRPKCDECVLNTVCPSANIIAK